MQDLEPLMLDLGLEVKETLEPNVITLPSGKTLILIVPTLMHISSTRVRKMVAAGKSIRFLVPESVREFIMEKGLYRRYENAR